MILKFSSVYIAGDWMVDLSFGHLWYCVIVSYDVLAASNKRKAVSRVSTVIRTLQNGSVSALGRFNLSGTG